MISFIVPIRNEVKFISKTIQSILNQKTKIDFEILIVDGLSIDGTREIIKDFQNNYSNIYLIDNPKRIVPVGFNKNKLPMGMQIIGKKNEDLKVLAFARKYEQMFNYSKIKPEI